MRPVINEWTDNYHLRLLRTIMMSPDDRALEDLLYSGDLGDEAKGAELSGGPAVVEDAAAVDHVSMTGGGTFTRVQVL